MTVNSFNQNLLGFWVLLYVKIGENSGLFNMGIPHIKLLWGKKIIKYGFSLKINQK